jgi:F-type H+-transporting ATPase subunit b
MQIAGIFLLPNGTFFVELLIIFVLLFITSKFILPPLTKAMDEREADVRDSIAAAETARADAAEADDERRAVVEAGRVQAREILTEASSKAERARADAQARGQAEYDRILLSAEGEISQARRDAIDAAAPQLGTIVMGVVERVIGRQVDMAKHQDLVDGAVAQLHASAGSSGSEVSA